MTPICQYVCTCVKGMGRSCKGNIIAHIFLEFSIRTSRRVVIVVFFSSSLFRSSHRRVIYVSIFFSFADVGCLRLFFVVVVSVLTTSHRFRRRLRFGDGGWSSSSSFRRRFGTTPTSSLSNTAVCTYVDT